MDGKTGKSAMLGSEAPLLGKGTPQKGSFVGGGVLGGVSLDKVGSSGFAALGGSSNGVDNFTPVLSVFMRTAASVGVSAVVIHAIAGAGDGGMHLYGAVLISCGTTLLVNELCNLGIKAYFRRKDKRLWDKMLEEMQNRK